MRALVICPWARTVSEIDLAPGLPAIYAALSHEAHKVGTFDCVRLDASETMYVDDEGLLSPGVPVFQLLGRQIAGRGLILGTDDEGDSVASGLAVGALKLLVKWQAVETSGDVELGRVVEAVQPGALGGYDFIYQGGEGVTQPRGTSFVEAVKKHALANYGEGKGWDYVIETQTDAELAELIGGALTEAEAIKVVGRWCGLMAEQERNCGFGGEW